MLRQDGPLGGAKVALQVGRFLWDDLALAFGLCLLTIHTNKDLAKGLAPDVLLPILGIAVSVFTSFRNNQAYTRWWEARSLWGALINQSRNWRDNLHSLLGSSEEAEAIKQPLLQRQVLLVWALNNELRERAQPHATASLRQLARGMGYEQVSTQALLVEQALTLEQLVRTGWINDFGRMQLQRVQDEICNSIGACEKIRNQPFPASYDTFIRISVWIFGFLFYVRMDAQYEPYGALVGYLVLAGFIAAERLGAYIEAPFAEPILALPMNRFCSTITRGLLGPAHPLATPPEGERATIWT